VVVSLFYVLAHGMNPFHYVDQSVISLVEDCVIQQMHSKYKVFFTPGCAV